MLKKYTILIGEQSMFGLGSPIKECGIIYSAFRENGGPVTEERGRMLLACNEKEYNKLLKEIPYYSVLTFKGKKEKNTIRVKRALEITPAPDSEEKAYLKQLKTPVTFKDPVFGVFVLNKRVDIFEGELRSRDDTICVHLNTQEDITTLAEIARDMDSFLKDAASYAAKELLDLGNEWFECAWFENAENGEEYVPMKAEDFMYRLRPETLSISDAGCYTLWHDDGGIFLGHAVCVDGCLRDGFTDASIQG